MCIRDSGYVEQHNHALAAALGGDQRRTVGQRRPGALGQLRVGFGQHLARDRDVVRHRHAVERPVMRETGKVLRLFPTQAAAKNAAAAAQFYRHQICLLYTSRCV